MAERFFNDIAEMTAFGAVTVMVFAVVPDRTHRSREQVSGLFDLYPDLGQIGQFQRSTVFFDEVFERHSVEYEIAIVIDIKSFLREIKGLIDQVKIAVGHCWIVFGMIIFLPPQK